MGHALVLLIVSISWQYMYNMKHTQQLITGKTSWYDFWDTAYTYYLQVAD